jgi:alpha-methylacyl-CoA racemase
VTGWGRSGPFAHDAGHDINYIGLTGILAAIGPANAPPTPPLNLVADFGGGGMLLIAGVLAALVERSISGRGQVVDAAMIDGANLLATMFHQLTASEGWNAERGSNILDGGAPFYGVYETADGRWMAVGALEAPFFRKLLTVLGIDYDAALQHDRSSWPLLRRELAAAFRGRAQAQLVEMFRGTDACVSPVLSFAEARLHPHSVDRDAFVSVDGAWQPSPAPRFDRTPAAHPGQTPVSGEHTVSVLLECGVDRAIVDRALEMGVIVQAAAARSS